MNRKLIVACLCVLALSLPWTVSAEETAGVQYKIMSTKPSKDGKAVKVSVVIKDQKGVKRTCTFEFPGSAGEENDQAIVWFSVGKRRCNPEYN